jgi:hypothetical protein
MKSDLLPVLLQEDADRGPGLGRFKETIMRVSIAVLFTLIVASTIEPSRADPYRWCAQYGGKSGATNCYFLTLEQCQAALSGNGGFCNPNNFYDGRPVVTPEDGVRRAGKRAAR